MSGPFSCRLLIDPPEDGAWNMAVDEALLDEAATAGSASLRFYEWSEPTLSLGYFQNHAARGAHPSSVDAVCVRRQSGGGAIMHDHELTYSLTLPKAHPLAADAQTLYTTVHEAIIAVLRNGLPEGVSPSQLCTYDSVEAPPQSEHFLCFQRRSIGDIVYSAESRTRPRINSHKVVGSAQRRNRGAVLQHGSLLLARSTWAPELAGLCDLCDNNLDTTHLKNELSSRILETLTLVVAARTLSDPALARAVALRNEKYRNRSWTQRR